MAYDLKKEEDVKQYLENLGIEYRFGCFKEKKPQVCHLLADYMEAIKKDFEKAGKVYKSNCLDYSFGKSCLKAGNYALLGRGKPGPDIPEAYKLFETGCDLDEPGSCLHAGLLLVAPSPTMNIVRDVPKGYNLLKKSCDLKDDKACHYLSGMYMSGVPKNVADYSPHNKDKNKKIDYIIKVDFKQAFDFAYKSCEMGNIFACANVSMMYAKGEGVKKNPELAAKFRKLAIDLQDAHQNAKEIQFQQGLDDKK